MSSIPEDLRYTKEHEWVRIEGDSATVGITDYAQNSLGDVVYLDGLEDGSDISANESIATVESVKAVSDIFAPLSGKITEINSRIADDPAILNSSPYEDGWLFKMSGFSSDETEALLDAKAYGDFLSTLE